jgi:hypothetical protein
MSSTVPPGRGFSASLPRHFVPGYARAVPPGRKHSPIEAPRIKLSLMRFNPREPDHPERRVLKGWQMKVLTMWQ